MKRCVAYMFLFLFFILHGQVKGQTADYAHSFEENNYTSNANVSSIDDGVLSNLQLFTESNTIAADNISSILPPPQERSIKCAKCKVAPPKRLKIYSPYANNRWNDSIASNYCDTCKFASSTSKTVLAVKSNLLYDALTLLNVSVEVPIGNKFSALVYAQSPWWRWGEANNAVCIRFVSLGAEGRWWLAPRHYLTDEEYLQRDRLAGHFMGIYAESGMWDFQFKRKICHQGEFWSVGVSYGYAMPISRHLNLEFSLSVGYASIPYRGYTPSEDYEILWRDEEKVGEWGYFGPTKAQVSLVVPIKATCKKGGRR